MSIATEITRLQTAKSNLKTSIENKGVTVPSSTTLDGYAALVDQISVGGGSGLEYETGTYTPTSDVSKPTINFANTHDKTPLFVMFVDCTGTYNSVSDTNHTFCYFDYNLAFGSETFPSSSTYEYGMASGRYRSTNASTFSTTSYYMTKPSSDTGSGSNSYPRYFVNEGWFNPRTVSSRYWRSGRTYKWIAVWL